MPFPSLYRAKAVSIRSGAVEAFVPQVFGETSITITDSLGTLPDAVTMGWVFFQAGDPDFPVWASGLGVGSAEAGPDVSGFTYVQATTPSATRDGETWYETDTGDSFIWTNGQWKVTATSGVVTGAGGFSYLRDTPPPSPKVAETWFDTSTGVSGGTAWIALEEGAAGSEKVWVQFAPGTAASLPAKLYATGFFASGTVLPTSGVVTPPFVSTNLTAARGLITASGGILTINKAGNYLITSTLAVNQTSVGGTYWHTQLYGYGGVIGESVDNGAQPYGTSAISVINYGVPVGTQIYVTIYSTTVGSSTRTGGSNLSVVEL